VFKASAPIAKLFAPKKEEPGKSLTTPAPTQNITIGGNAGTVLQVTGEGHTIQVSPTEPKFTKLQSSAAELIRRVKLNLLEFKAVIQSARDKAPDVARFDAATAVLNAQIASLESACDNDDLIRVNEVSKRMVLALDSETMAAVLSAPIINNLIGLLTEKITVTAREEPAPNSPPITLQPTPAPPLLPTPAPATPPPSTPVPPTPPPATSQTHTVGSQRPARGPSLIAAAGWRYAAGFDGAHSTRHPPRIIRRSATGFWIEFAATAPQSRLAVTQTASTGPPCKPAP
jgi:hypothetical protein